MTTSDDSLSQRGRAFEEMFYRNLDAKLIDDLKAAESSKAAREALIQQTGLKDSVLIDQLVRQGVTAEGLMALRLIPLVLVAWADREVTAEERVAILEESRKLGIDAGSVGRQLLGAWLSTPPAPELADLWQRHTQHLLEGLSETARKEYAKEVEHEMTSVARASGGILGFASISDAESRVISRLTAVLHGPAVA